MQRQGASETAASATRQALPANLRHILNAIEGKFTAEATALERVKHMRITIRERNGHTEIEVDATH